jgi:Kef-type K+ transport system membrane component KefB
VTAILTAAFAAGLLTVVRPALRWRLRRSWPSPSGQLLAALTLALGSAWVTAELGLLPVFGGFLAGLAMPGLQDGPDAQVLRPLDDIGNLLLPLFFVVTGLSLSVGALGLEAVGMLAVICVIASAGKVLPGYAAARAAGIGPRDSAAIAALVNTRGLTELIVLNVGLTSGIISRQLFSILVLMALITTVLTAPVLSGLLRPAKDGPRIFRSTTDAPQS